VLPWSSAGHPPREAGRPAARLLADALSWNKDYKESLDVFAKLLADDPDNAELKIRQAEVTLWSFQYDLALQRYQAVLDAKFDQPKLWPGFIDAASSASSLTAANGATAKRIDRDTAAEPPTLPFLSRLAWVLYRAGEPARSEVLLRKVVALQPEGPKCAGAGRCA
jgi:tetratricopeptide (TPR) repeat protein